MSAITKTELIKEKLGTNVTTQLFDFLNTTIQKHREEIVKEQAHEHEKIELRFEGKLSEFEARVINEIAKVRTELRLDIANLHTELKSEIEALRSEYRADNDKLRISVEKTKADLIKWMFLFWIGTVITILGGLFGFLKLFMNQ